MCTKCCRPGDIKAGLYTSPYLEVFNERIEFDGSYITDQELELYTAKVLEKAWEMVEEGLESPTEFEVVTAIAFLYFKEKQADYVCWRWVSAAAAILPTWWTAPVQHYRLHFSGPYRPARGHHRCHRR